MNDGYSIPQEWDSVKMGTAQFYQRVAKNADAEKRRAGGLIAVDVKGKRVAVYNLRSKVLAFAPVDKTTPPPPTNGASNPQADKEKLAPFSPSDGARRADDGRPYCPLCQKVMVIRFNGQEPFWGCVCRRGNRKFYPLPEDLERAGHYWVVASAYTLERFCDGRSFKHLWEDRYTPEMIKIRRKVRAQKVTPRTVEALKLIFSKRPTAAIFRREFWPDSKGSASYLPSLVARGLVCQVGDFHRLTVAGTHTLSRSKLVEAGLTKW